MSKIIKRIVNKTGISDIIKILRSLPPTDLQSLLLKVFQTKVSTLNVSNVVEHALNNRFVEKATANQRDMIAFDNIAYNVLPDKFEAIELSPVSPLGINNTLCGTSQNNVVTTVRNTEVTADSTSALSLLSARARTTLLKSDRKNTERVDHATSHRILRGQSFDDIDGFTPHFRMFTITTAGRDIGNGSFEKDVILEHVTFYLSLLDSLIETERYHAENITVSFSDIRIIEKLIDAYGMDRLVLGRNTQNPSYSAFEEYDILLPSTLESMRDFVIDEKLNLNTPRTLLSLIEQSVINPLQELFPNVTFLFDFERTAGMGYYSTQCFKITADNIHGHTFPLVDGGMSTWTQQILGSKKERFFSSGIGSELFCNMFKKS